MRFSEDFIRIASATILKLVEKGDSKPIDRVGAYFDKLCDPNSAYYNKKFHNEMLKKVPEWVNNPITVRIKNHKSVFIKPSTKTLKSSNAVASINIEKAKILNLISNSSNPILTDDLLETTLSLCDSKSTFYDKNFRSLLSHLAPKILAKIEEKLNTAKVESLKHKAHNYLDKLVDQQKATEESKQLNFIKLDDTEEVKKKLFYFHTKPHFKTKYSIVLYQSTTPSNKHFDPVFNEKIRAAKPHWFTNEPPNYLSALETILKPVKSEPVKSEPVKSEPVKSEPVKSEPVKSEPVKSEPVKSESVKSEPSNILASIMDDLQNKGHIFEVEVVRDFIKKDTKERYRKYVLKPVYEIDKKLDVYRCPYCKGDVIIHKGIKQPYAVHKDEVYNCSFRLPVER